MGVVIRPLLLAVLLLVATATTGCSGLQINEALCSKGEEPIWAVSNTVGADCVRDGDPTPAGFARYPRGRVPVWINPPGGYDHRTADGRDLYNVNPNNPGYPWWDEVLAAHPELGCDGTSEPLTTLAMQPRGPQSPMVTMRLNAVGNRCFRFDWNKGREEVVGSVLRVAEGRNGPVWHAYGPDDASASRLLRIASDSCLRVTAALRLERTGGRLTTYRLSRAKVPRTCDR